jgi:predicted LPLAT superfamily acyltransferase
MARDGYNHTQRYSKAALLDRLKAWKDEAETGRCGFKEQAPRHVEALEQEIERLFPGTLSDT